MGEPLLQNLLEPLEFKKRDFGSRVMEPMPKSRGGKLDIVIIPKSLGILIFQRHFPPCGRGPPRLPRYKTLRVFPGVGSGRRGQLGLGGWVSGENNPDFLPRDFSRWGFAVWDAAASNRARNPGISAALPTGFPKGVVVVCSSRGWEKR